MSKFAEAMFEYHEAESSFTSTLVAAGFGHYRRIDGDWYDNSIVFVETGDNERMSEDAQRIVYDAGFSSAYLKHSDGWETIYSWDQRGEFAMSKGWRRRWVFDPKATTTNVVGTPVTPSNAGYYEISYWPETWANKNWLDNGYMRIVPDPLAQPL